MLDLDPQTQANLRRARTYQNLPPDHYLTPFTSFADLLDQRARERPDDLFLIAYDDDAGTRQSWTFRQFNQRVNQVANLLRHTYGVQRGERVATLAYNHPDTVFTYFACWKLGAAIAPQNVSEDDARISFILRNASCRVVLVRPDYHARLERIRADAPGVTEVVLFDAVYTAQVDAQSSEFTPPAVKMLEDEALLVYTSGTTGAPKGVQLIQYNLLVDAKGLADWQCITPEQRMMCVLPIHHVNGTLVTLVTPLVVGTAVVLNRAFKASLFWQRCAEEQVAVVSVVPTLLQFLCEANADISRYDLSRLRHFICGAGTLSVALAVRFEQQFAKPILHGYGLSETTCYSCFLPLDLTSEEHHRWLSAHGYPSIGVPIAPNEMAIHNDEGRALPAGVKGEIVVRGHNVMTGYFQRPDANAETFKHGWFRTGDEGFVAHDDRGRSFFFITGRLKELINRGGVKYSPFEIEEVLLRIPGVSVGLVVAFDNVWYGEEVGAYIVRTPGATLTEDEILSYCRRHMPFAKAPKAVVFGDDVPVTTTGKYQRLKLNALFAQYNETQFKG